MRWHKALNRMGDTAYLGLSPVAQAALRNLDELGQLGPVVGSRTRLCVLLGIEPKHARHALEPLIEAGFVEATDEGGQLVLSLPSEVLQVVVNGSSTGRQRVSNGVPTGVQRVSNGSPTGVQQAFNGGEETPDDAGSGDPALKENKSKNKSKSKSKNTVPALPPAGFVQWWAMYPRKLQRQAALAAWCKINPPAELEALMIAALGKAIASADWQGRIAEDPSLRTIPLPATWLNGCRWEDEYGPPLPVVTTPTVIDREKLNAIRLEQQFRRGGIPEPARPVEVDADGGGRDLPLLSGGELW